MLVESHNGDRLSPELSRPRVPIRRRQMLTEEVYDSIISLLMNHEVQPGERLNIDALSRMIGVSVTPVRETLARLESEALVTKIPLVGYTATPLLTADALLDMYEVRFALEPLAARQAALRSTDAQIAGIEASASTMRLSPTGDRWEDYRLFAIEDGRFHAAIAEASGNVFVGNAIERLHAHLHLYRLFFHSGVEQRTLREHEPILDSLRNHDGDGAERAMAAHLEESRARLLEVASALQSGIA